MAKLGIKELLKKDDLWLCAACYTCTERCPQGVEVTELIRVLKNLAIDEGCYPDYYRGLSSNLIRSGLAYVISGSRLRVRKKYGLPPLPETKVEDIRKLAEVTGLTQLIEQK
jgi:heterodisulfide reductase subunit C